MRKLVILVGLSIASFTVFANTPVEDFRSYRVAKTDIIKVSPFCISVAKGDFEMVQKMIELGADVNEVSNQMTPLMFAARYNHLEIIKLLVANGAKTNTKDAKGYTAAQYAELANAQDAKVLLQSIQK